ncbi:peptidase M23-like protein [Tepidamorphus gemmatus]|uniref:Peptidase M23-like protein n=1 Tax=Tepidamorphus gemmatus TaxID=747076 RepID=A0A4R3M161_9HYPH|nr:peptidase M23-like protein [Tepidamorphus gemmatus]
MARAAAGGTDGLRGTRLVNIGREPALTFDAQQPRESAVDRRRINLRWLASTVLTGLAGASLMGGALFIAFDRQAEFATNPDIPFGGVHAEAGTIGAGKGDRIVIRTSHVSSRQVIQETSVRSVGGKEFVMVTPYVRVTASLPLSRTEFTEQAPPFNPLKLFADVGAWNDDRAAPTMESDESVSIRYSVLSPRAIEDGGERLTLAEIEETIRENVDFAALDLAFASPVILPLSATGYAALGPLESPAQAAAADLARYAATSPANVTTVFKRPSLTSLPRDEEVRVQIQKGDTLESVLIDHGATPQEAAELIAIARGDGGVPILQVGDEVRITVAPDAEDPERMRPVAVVLPAEGQSAERTVALALAQPLFSSGGALRTGSLRPSSVPAPSQTGPRASVYEGIYDSALRMQVPQSLITEMIKVFSFDVDFQRNTSPGDMLELFYAETGEEEGSSQPELLYASIGVRGEIRRYYRFRTPDDGVVDYYDETGKSAKKFLMRKPMTGGTFRSGYGMRRHPILGYTRMHSGVDWSARTGTPIMASGNGTIVYADWKSGYGRHIRIRHANGYETSYSHMSGFARGIAEGVQVRQGQIIGYVGSTGLSTGPHLHYEVLVNGRNVDPMRIRLPRGRVLEGRVLAAFEKEKYRIDSLMNRAPASTRVASAGE